MSKIKYTVYITFFFVVLGAGLYFVPAREVLRKDAAESIIGHREIQTIQSETTSEKGHGSVTLSDDLTLVGSVDSAENKSVNATVTSDTFQNIENYANQNPGVFLNEDYTESDSDFAVFILTIESRDDSGKTFTNTIHCSQKCPSETTQLLQWLDDLIVQALPEN